MEALIATLLFIISIYWWIVIASAVFSWLYAFNVVNPRNQFVGQIGSALYRLTEPVFAPIRRVLPDLGGIDISPIVVIVILYFLDYFVRATVAPALLGA
jgi:YggT family protein